MPLWLGAGMIGTSAAGAALQYMGGQQTNQMSWDQMIAQQQFSAEMSNTAHQREVADLKAAGLNPILSAGGSGASTPSAGSASFVNPAEGMASSANSMSKMMMDLVSQSSEIAKNKATADAANAAAGLTKQQAVSEGLRQISYQNQNKISDAEAFSARNKMDFEMKSPGVFGALDAVLSRAGLLTSSARDVLGSGAALKYLLKPGDSSSRSLPINAPAAAGGGQ